MSLARQCSIEVLLLENQLDHEKHYQARAYTRELHCVYLSQYASDMESLAKYLDSVVKRVVFFLVFVHNTHADFISPGCIFVDTIIPGDL